MIAFRDVHWAGGAFDTARHALFCSGLPARTQTGRTGGQNRDQGGSGGAGDYEHVSMMVPRINECQPGPSCTSRRGTGCY